ncbi:MAG TPA: hypothetical protein VKR30_04830 [Candidatus Limnocylindrales bacterium]|nr:hypothetical protein [Candidatus Limnocylindrales bacterium]
MPGLRNAGALWLTAGVVCVGLLIVVFVGENVRDLGALLRDPFPPGLVLAGAVVALSLGALLIFRPGPAVVRWSTVAGIAWLVVYGSWALTMLPTPGPLTSTVLITGFGVAGALVAYLSRKQVAR